jgi:hypothetical protein
MTQNRTAPWKEVPGRQGWFKQIQPVKTLWRYMPSGSKTFHNLLIMRPESRAGMGNVRYFIMTVRGTRMEQIDSAHKLDEAFDKIGARMMNK